MEMNQLLQTCIFMGIYQTALMTMVAFMDSGYSPMNVTMEYCKIIPAINET